MKWNVNVNPAIRGKVEWSISAALCLGSVIFLAGCHPAPGADVSATVNGKPILHSEVEKYYKNSQGENPPAATPEQEGIQRLNVLRQLIDEEVLQQRAAKTNLVASDEEVDAKLAEMKAPFTQEEFNGRLKASGLSLDDLRKNLRRSLTIEKLLNKEINTKIDITDSDISGYYNKNKAAYNLVEPSYHLAEILVTTLPPQQPGGVANGKATNEAEAKKKIEMLHQRLASGEDFGTLAANFSEQPNTASNGGDRGFVSESELKSEPTVYAAVSKLKPGEVTDVLAFYDNPNSPQKKIVGYAIYRVLAREPAGQRQLNDPRVQQDVRQRLRDARSQLLKTAYYEMLRDQAKIVNYDAENIFKQK
jgi:peptidyl-prolyl cis-trans isomerase SurA